ncbi:hypothetical protein MPTK1_1g15920 [Marchantia polymorpha subsp. ruderalis]|uniref:Uncharacterized protein n=2 Tax=Marchantia polymorpha TaxID=3197 RepID=A0AAF6AQM7_MARPO|nr:hypothetical protein MARPO_0033s0068 [Marchantia polymorpha]BBM98747.1 hypothetical protein Mp_1g15920 [Marchantia polymorpha subsp. ruderalis]|eukprot:PTQ41658.1 hypothetical protein MARPO_0033s0068 [Marchantia polymorpha]
MPSSPVDHACESNVHLVIRSNFSPVPMPFEICRCMEGEKTGRDIHGLLLARPWVRAELGYAAKCKFADSSVLVHFEKHVGDIANVSAD